MATDSMPGELCNSRRPLGEPNTRRTSGYPRAAGRRPRPKASGRNPASCPLSRDKAGDEHGRPGEEDDGKSTCAATKPRRKRCCPTLPLTRDRHLSSHRPIGAGALPGGIVSHDQAGDQRKREREDEDRPVQVTPPSSAGLPAILGATETVQSARQSPITPAITLTSVLSITNKRTIPRRDAPRPRATRSRAGGR